MFIEDIFQILVSIGNKTNYYDQNIVNSFSYQLSVNKELTEKQSKLIIKLLKKYKKHIDQCLNLDIDQYLNNPVFKNPFRLVSIHKNISIIDTQIYGKTIKLDFNYNESIINKIKQIRQLNSFVAKCSHFDSNEKSWLFELNEQNLIALQPLLIEFQFEIDTVIKNYLDQIAYVQSNLEKFLPMVVNENNHYKIINLNLMTENSEINSCIDLLFLARKFGVTVWDENIENELSNNSINELVKKFLKTDPGTIFEVDLSKNDILSISDIVKYLFPCLVIIPGGLEFEKLQQALKIFHNIGITNQEMSVLFRLDNSSNFEFNQYIKTNNLNNPVQNSTKVVFLSQTIPKTILSPYVKFHSLINFNYINVHHKISFLIKNQENVINIIENNNQRRFSFANL